MTTASLNLPFGNIKDDVAAAVRRRQNHRRLRQRPLRRPGPVLDQNLTKILTVAETFLNITPT
jgi:hypothetical protein